MQKVCVESELINESYAKIATLQQQNKELKEGIRNAFKEFLVYKDHVLFRKDAIKNILVKYNENCYEPIVLDKENESTIVKTIQNLRNEITNTVDKMERFTKEGAFDITIEKFDMQIEALADTVNLIIQFCVQDVSGDAAVQHIREFGL